MAKKSKKIVNTKPKAAFPEKLMKYLEAAGIPHEVISHRTVYTAYDAAATMKKKLNEIAKSILVKADKDYWLIILPADENVDFKKLGAFLKKVNKKEVKMIKIPGEKIITELLNLKNQTVGAFGKLHNLPVAVEKNLVKAKKAIFSSGDFNNSVQMKVNDFIRLENALLGSFGVKKKIKLIKTSRIKARMKTSRIKRSRIGTNKKNRKK